MKALKIIVLTVVALPLVAVAALGVQMFREDAGRNQLTVELEAPPEVVYAHLTRLEHVRRWVGGLVEVTPLEGTPKDAPPQVGMKSKLIVEVDGQRTEMRQVITAVEAPGRFEFELSSGDASLGFTEQVVYRIEASGKGSKLTCDANTTYHGFIKLFEPLITPKAQQKLTEDLGRLSALVAGATATVAHR